MTNPSHGRSSFWTQANALLRKNVVYQKRNKRANTCLIILPMFLCVLLALLQVLVNNELKKSKYKCGCGFNGTIEVCGLEYSTSQQAAFCPIPNPAPWPPLLQIPAPEYRAVKTDFIQFSDLPSDSCRKSGTCPATILFTGSNKPLAQNLSANLLTAAALNQSDILGSLAQNVLGSASWPGYSNFLDSAFTSDLPIYAVQHQCILNSTVPLSIPINSDNSLHPEVQCSQGLNLWRNSFDEINDELYKGYREANSEMKINEIVAAYDFMNSNRGNFNVSVWYNSTYNNYTDVNRPIALLRVPRSVNLVSNAYLQFLLGPRTKMLFEFVKEMPKHETRLRLDISSLLNAQFFTYVIILLFPTILTFLVYEKQHNLRIMMKMHGLGDGPYWMISYAYFLALSLIYMLFFVVFGSLIGLKVFITNDYSIQFVFYFMYINLQIGCAFLLAPLFSNVMTARVVGYLLTFGTGLLGRFLFEPFIEDTSFPRPWIVVMELYPGFSLYRGLYELGQYSFNGFYMGTEGMRWKNLSDSGNGMQEILVIMFVETLLVLLVAYYVDQVASSGSGVRKSPLFFLSNLRKKSSLSLREPSLRRHGSKVFVQMEKADVIQEREKVEQLLLEPSTSNAVVCANLRKVYPGRDGNPPKVAVNEISLALPHGECFGMLGPNGAGKTSFISMMIGLTEPTSGTAFVEGLNIQTQMDEIYCNMGVCPQHDLLWELLTGREHLLFYGRLKNLKGNALMQAVEESLKSVNLFHGGVGDKLTGQYSGGMKRRLSVAISLIGDPKVVYMDEPSTGLDPASRNNLWSVVKRAKEDRAIILTTHSMEEAEVLCDRLGIFVNGSLQCIGNPKELRARYGGSFVFTVTTAPDHENEVGRMVQSLSPNAQKIYHLSGTQKFELLKQEVRISEVFQAINEAKRRFSVQAWGLADTTLEDVFIKVAREAQAFNVLS